MKNPNPDKPINIQILNREEDWTPLTIFLKGIFEDNYKEALDGFMFMGVIEFWDGAIVYDYKHGITRKAITLLENGDSVLPLYDTRLVMNHETGRNKSETFVAEIVKRSTQDTFQHVYKDIDKMMFTEKGIFTAYNREYLEKRDNFLKEKGYNVISGTPEEIVKQITNLNK
jgi:hypothetical protein